MQPQRRAMIAMGAALIGLGLFYLTIGFKALLTDPRVAYDLRLRWVDQRYVHNRQNPFDVFFAARGGDRAAYERRTGRDARPIESVGVPKDVGYPPWSYPVGSLWFWPDWPAVRGYWAGVNAVAVAAIVAFCLRVGRGWPVLAVGLGLACSAYAINLSIGQAAIVVVALVMWALLLAGRRPYLAGLLMTLAMFKPTIAMPFLLCLLVAGRWRTVLLCGLGVAGLSGLTWALTSTPPWEMLGQMRRASLGFVGLGTGPIRFLIRAGVDPSAAAKVVMLTSVTLAAAGMWIARNAGILALAAVAAVGGRFWTYHAVYDDGMLVFLVLWIAAVAWEKQSWAWLALLVVVGLSLWVPGRFYTPGRFACAGWVQAYQQLAWTTGAAAVVATAARRRRADDPIIAA